jgi:hypothetical protein
MPPLLYGLPERRLVDGMIAYEEAEPPIPQIAIY